MRMSTSTNKLLDRLVKARLVSQKGKPKTYEIVFSRKERDRLIDLLVKEETEATKRAESDFRMFDPDNAPSAFSHWNE
jgi:hypothetical protein